MTKKRKRRKYTDNDHEEIAKNFDGSISDFSKAHRTTYKWLLKHGRVDEFLERKNGKYTDKDHEKLAKNFEGSISEFKKVYGTTYNWLCKANRVDEFFERKIKRYTEADHEELARNFNGSISEFVGAYQATCIWLRKHDRIDEFFERLGNKYNNCVYFVYNEPLMQCYIGITYNTEERWADHKHRDNGRLYFMNHPDTIYIKLTDYITKSDAGKIEDYLLQYFDAHPEWRCLNKIRSGAGRVKYTPKHFS